MKKRVLVIPSHAASFKEAVRFFSLQDQLEPVFVVQDESIDLADLGKVGWTYLDWRSVSKKERGGRWRPIAKRYISFFFDDTLIGVLGQRTLFSYFFERMFEKRLINVCEKIRGIISQEKVDAVLLFNDRSTGVEASALLASSANGVPVFGMSFGNGADYESSIKIRQKMVYKKFVSKSDLASYKHYDGHVYLFYRPYEAKVLNKHGVLSNNPWVLGSGALDAFFMGSDRELKRSVDNGGDASKYAVTGMAAHDLLYQAYKKRDAIKREITDKYGLASRKIVVVALPQYYEHKLLGREAHFSLMKRLIKSLPQENIAYLISLHPKMKAEDYAWLDEVDGIHRVDEDVSRLIPIASLFISSYSSVVEWALMCSIPVLNLDLVEQKYSNFYKEFNLATISRVEELSVAVEKKLNEPLLSTTAENKMSLPPLDGSSVSRIVNLIESRS